MATSALSAPSRSWLGAIGALVGVFAGFAVAYALLVPVGASPDELSHLNYARLIADRAQLPLAYVREHQQPPLYYLLGAGLLKAGAPAVSLRLLSAVAGASGVVAGGLIARVVAPRQRLAAVGAAGLLALLPGSQFVAGSITDDALAIAVGAWVLLTCVTVLRSPAPTRRLLVAVGVVIGIALITKQTDWAPLTVLVIALAWRWRTTPRWRHVIPLAGPPLLIAGWWYARNLATFHSLLPPLVLGERLRFQEARGFVSETVRSWFRPERYQGGLITLPPQGVLLEEALIAALIVLMLFAAYHLVRVWPALERPQRASVIALCAAAVLAIASTISNSVTVIIQPQGRYVLPSVAAAALAVGAVLSLAAARRVRLAWSAASVCAVAAMALSAIGLHTSLVAYG